MSQIDLSLTSSEMIKLRDILNDYEAKFPPKLNVKSISQSSYSMGYDGFLLVDTTAGDVTITPPRASNCQGVVFQLKVSSGSNSVIITPSNGTIDGQASFTFKNNCAIVSDGNNFCTVAYSEVGHDHTMSELTDYVTPSSLMDTAGRWYLYADNRWITDSDDNYGTSYYQFAESGGTGTTPIAEWEHMGKLVPAGKTINKLHFVGRSNSDEVTDLEFYIILRKPDPITRWETGLDNDAEDVEVVLYNNLFFAPTDGGTAFSGNMSDRHWRTIDINHLVTENSYLSIYIRPTGTLTATRYFTSTFTWDIT